MNKTSLILLALMTVALTLWIAPGVIAMNQGKMLRNIALWLAIFAGLGFIYKTFGPDSDHPLFSVPPGVEMRMPGHPPIAAPPGTKTDDDKSGGSQGFTPPGE